MGNISMADRERSKGFVLIELLVVMFILSILASTMIPLLRRAFYRAKVTGCVINLRNLSTAMNQYFVEYQVYPDDLGDLAPTFIKTIPTCPAAQIDTYTTGYQKAGEPQQYSLHCGGINHSEMGLGENEPYYNIDSGLGPYQAQ